MLHPLSWNHLERFYSLRSVLLKRLPPPIYGVNPGANDCVPIFAQHAPGPRYLQAKLDHLRRAGFQTIDTFEYRGWLDGAVTLSRPSVMLTFDDGMRRFKDVTLPVLKKEKLKCVLFICPGLVELASGPVSPIQAFFARDILRWDEINEIHQTGFVDIQSHGMWHNRVRISDDVILESTASPSNVFSANDLLPPDDRLERLVKGNGTAQPVPRYAAHPFFLTSAGINQQANFETMMADLSRSKRLIEENVPGQVAHAFAFPWWNGTETARRAAQQAGFALIFEGARHATRKIGRRSVKPNAIGRLNFDFINCLAGDGRTDVMTLFMQKIRGLHQDDVS